MRKPAVEKPGAYSVQDAAIFLSVSERTVWEMISRGEIDSLTIGKRRLIPRDELERIIAERRSRKAPNGDTEAA